MVYELIDCNYKMVYIGISKTPWLRIYAHRSRYGVIGKYGCDDKCKVNMLIIRGFKKRSQCRRYEKYLIERYQPIWNTQHNHDPYKSLKRHNWRIRNCGCE